MKKEILVTGGAGYIGSHAVRLLNQQYGVIVLDNLIYGHQASIVDKEVIFYKGDVGDPLILNEIFQNHKIEAVMHFAAFTSVGESVREPAKYYRNNVVAPLVLLECMRMHNCVNFIFSSTCATYGFPQYIPLDELHPQAPINPYGKSKYILEQIVADYAAAYGFRYGILRYFNASGAWEDGSIGEDHNPETHLIPLILKAIKGEINNITVFGSDYDTPDGTCVRDYIHVVDLARAHVKALEVLLNRGESFVCNLGTGKGTSVADVIKAAEAITRKKVPVVMGSRREGDSTQLVANADRAKEILGWEPEYKELNDIVKSAWNWENGKFNGRYTNF